ncbi:WGR domain-containing protein [Nonomuraea sp. NPDC049784]|uniref:WGR domain-containing protein n=1 Tax=Nonomuraea sp. NPDC049784 TaxID=3154361 RepID=UPI0034049D0A
MPRALGWEVRHTSVSTDRNSDKFYRLLVVDDVLIVNYGRMGSAGRFKITQFDDVEAARENALRLTGEKERQREAYLPFREPAVFEVHDDDLHNCRYGSASQSQQAKTRIVRAFTDAAPTLPWPH